MSNLKWFHYSQNNSGGYFIDNDDVSHDIFVQAESAELANIKAEKITADYSEFCDCCGERWYIYADDGDGTETPEIYGEKLFSVKPSPYRNRAILYFANGHREVVILKN